MPSQALPQVFRSVGSSEPLRATLAGSRVILYFGARGDAGLTHAVVFIGLELVFWAALGFGACAWYDYKTLDRSSPDVIEYINKSVDQAVARRAVRG